MLHSFFVFLSCFILLARSLRIIPASDLDEQEAPFSIDINRPEFTPISEFKTIKHTTVYVIRHGEKPESGRRGLSRLGRKRAKCVESLFGPESGINIDYIIAAPAAGRVKSSRSIDTVKPLANALNFEIDSYCGAGDAKCVANRVKYVQRAAFYRPANVLIVGRHSKIRNIVKALGVEHPPSYPDAYGLTWKVRNGELEVLHQDCPEVDEDLDSNSLDEYADDEDDSEFYNYHGFENENTIHESRREALEQPEILK